MAAPNGTTEVRTAHRFDEQALAGHLSAHLPRFSGPLSVRQFEGGQSNPTYYLETPAGACVLRKKPPGVLLPSAHLIEREYRVMSALRTAGIPVPEPYLLCEDPTVIGTPFYVMAYVPGRVFRDPFLRALAPDERAAIYANMTALLARLHSVDIDATGLADFGKRGGYYARQIARWSRQYLASQTDDVPAMTLLMEWLPAHLPPEEPVTLVHGDFRLENLVFHASEPRVVALMDWELSTLGEPLSDLAYNSLPYHVGPDLFALAPGDPPPPGIPDESRHLGAYCEARGRQQADHWPFHVAMSLFRLASIMQGIYARGRQGNASSAEALRRGPAMQYVAARAWELARRS